MHWDRKEKATKEETLHPALSLTDKHGSTSTAPCFHGPWPWPIYRTYYEVTETRPSLQITETKYLHIAPTEPLQRRIYLTTVTISCPDETKPHHYSLVKTHAAHQVFVQLTVSQLAEEFYGTQTDYRARSVGIATSYGLIGPGLKPR